MNPDHLQTVLAHYPDVFQPELGMMKDFKAKIFVDPTVSPHFCKARSVPYAMRSLVEAELDKLVDQGILTPVKPTDWAAPIVPVMKADKTSVRICGDFKQTVNKASPIDKYSISRIEDLFTKLPGGRTFTKLDMSQGYQQLCLDEESQKFVVIILLKDFSAIINYPLIISSAPGIFQSH